ncbi:RNA polymerase sigma-70 factor, ECF subfamily [Chitinophaga jiangningensis]|uniref:RNA polymerase sigma-70 factor, ECF subfamily n=1 Tax=Chitinophaga jiangningensis TaxID=1419482 RepID=A0A1M6W2C9_9BACT|nr:RNA polymerase sigma factor [Chitinophaga jiangningensis]SHK87809.1 RNA polymerase sigma-70 factor, ECF subfamily [Chitinophaga jiangningensis]
MSTKIVLEEKELLQQAAEGDREAYGQLYARYYDSLYHSLSFLVKSETEAEELIQDAFVKTWISRETLMLVRSFGDYMFTVAKNLRIDKMRSRNTRTTAEFTYQEHRPESDPLSDDIYLYKQYYETAWAAVQQLHGKKKSIFLLRTQEGLTLQEIAEREGISRSAVKKHLYTALEQMKMALVKNGEWMSVLVLLVMPSYL